MTMRGLAWHEGYKNVELEVDSQCVMQMVTEPGGQPNENSSIISTIKEMLGWNWVVRVRHVNRESNFAAD